MKEKFDIIVVGGGFAGSAAAIAAARQGKKVLLVEKYNCLGGAAVFNLVNPFMPYATRDPKGGEPIVLSRGLFGEVVKRLDEMGGLRKKDKSCFNEEILKYVLMKMAQERRQFSVPILCYQGVPRRRKDMLDNRFQCFG